MRSIKLAQIALAFMILLNSGANSNSVSGVYVQKFADGILFIQIVKSPDGKVSGRVEVVSMQPSGILKDRSYSLDGTIDGNQIEPPRDCRRLFGLSYAAMAGCSSMA